MACTSLLGTTRYLSHNSETLRRPGVCSQVLLAELHCPRFRLHQPHLSPAAGAELLQDSLGLWVSAYQPSCLACIPTLNCSQPLLPILSPQCALTNQCFTPPALQFGLEGCLWRRCPARAAPPAARQTLFFAGPAASRVHSWQPFRNSPNFLQFQQALTTSITFISLVPTWQRK